MACRSSSLLLAFALAGCYQVEHPTQWACSAAEPLCPEGQVCDGKRCVQTQRPDTGAGDLQGRDSGRDFTVRDTTVDVPGPTPDVAVPCSALTDWSCVTGRSWIDLKCANRLLYCDDDYGWYCGCLINGAEVYDPDCGDVPDQYNVCDIAYDALYYGCCRP